MKIIVKVAQGKSVIDFRVFNHTLERAITYKELLRKINNSQYDLVILEEIESDKIKEMREVSRKVKTALVCGRSHEYIDQIELVSSEKLNIDVLTQAGELDDYVERLSGITTRFREDTMVPVEVGPLDDENYVDVTSEAMSGDGLDSSFAFEDEPIVRVEEDSESLKEDNGESTGVSEDDIIKAVLGDVDTSDSHGDGDEILEVIKENGGTPRDDIGILSDQIRGYKQRIEKLEDEISSLVERLGETERDRDSYKDECDSLEHKIERLKEDALENAGGVSSGNVAELENELMDVKEQLESALREVNGLKGTNESLQDKIKQTDESSTEENGTLKDENNTLKSEIIELRNEVDQLKEQADSNKEIIAEHQRIKELISTICEIMTEAEKIENDTPKSVNTIEDIIEALQGFVERVRGLVVEKGRVSEENSEVRGLYEKCKVQSDEQSEKIQLLENELREVKEKVASKDVEIEQMRERANSVNKERDTELSEAKALVSDLASDRSRLKEVNSKLNQTCSQLQSSLQETEIKLTNMENERNEWRKRYSNANINNKNLQERLEKITASDKNIKNVLRDLKSANEKIVAKDVELAEVKERLKVAEMETGRSTIGTVNMNKGYKGKGKIIHVFGSGSFGVTSIAMTLANKITGKNVIFVDLDLVSPKADSWFNINPICSELTDIKVPVGRTGVSALINKGADYVIQNFSKIVKNKAKARGSSFDYFSGTYVTPVSGLIYRADWTKFFNFLGSRYDYIIVESGRIGSSDAYDSVIRTICDMAYRNVVITLGDKFDVRTQKVKMEYAKIDNKKTVWVLNMCDSSIVDEDIEKLLNGIKNFKLFKVLNYYGTRRPMDIAVPVLKEPFDEIAKSVM